MGVLLLAKSDREGLSNRHYQQKRAKIFCGMRKSEEPPFTEIELYPPAEVGRRIRLSLLRFRRGF